MARPSEVMEVNKMVAITNGIICKLPVHNAFDFIDMAASLQDDGSPRWGGAGMAQGE